MKFRGPLVILNDNTCWPRPGGDEGHDARYGTPAPLLLASFVSAYDTLIMLPQRRRNEVIRALRIARRRRDKYGDVINDLVEMERLFLPRCKLTLVMRDPENREAFIVLTSEETADLPKVAALVVPQLESKEGEADRG